jgi:DNA invertase Pin-like site-specific DNA recombinase
MSTIGYLRVSREEQRADLQEDALKAAGAIRIFEDRGVSGSKASRPGLSEALSFMRDGDIFTVWRLDRAGRSTLNVLELLRTLEDRGIGFRSLTEGVDTTTPAGRVLATMLASFAQMEREIIVERTLAGLAAARARGNVGGRPRALSAVRIEQARLMYRRGSAVTEIATILGVGRATVYRAIESKSDVK